MLFAFGLRSCVKGRRTFVSGCRRRVDSFARSDLRFSSGAKPIRSCDCGLCIGASALDGLSKGKQRMLGWKGRVDGSCGCGGRTARRGSPGLFIRGVLAADPDAQAGSRVMSSDMRRSSSGRRIQVVRTAHQTRGMPRGICTFSRRRAVMEASP
jgi:hypothetical protein